MQVNCHKNFSIRPLRELKSPEKALEATKHLTGPWWISSGTALGLHRDGDFIPDDTDIDVGIRVNGLKDTPLFEIPGFDLIRTVYHDGLPMQMAYQNEDGVIFDIYFYYDIGKPDLWNHAEHGEWWYPKCGINERDTKYGTFPFPDPIETYLLKRYGPTWMIPQHKKGLYGNDF